MRKKFPCIVFVLALVVSLLVSPSFADTGEKNVTILFTSDMHEHFLPNKMLKNDDVALAGGYARLKTAIDQEQARKKNSILVDAGDYSMGTLFQSIYASDAPELRILGQLEYDVTTFGNHEFDFRDSGLTRSLYAAKNSGERLPQIVSSNMVFPEQMTQSLYDLKKAMEAYGVSDYTVIERGGVRIGVFGLLGKDSSDKAPMAGVNFDDIVKSAQKIVKVLKEKEKADMIVCLSHSGTSDKVSESEDQVLAKKVPDIDVIISGHTHTQLDKPIVSGNTVIGACGEYANYLGVIDLTGAADGRWRLDNYALVPVNSSLESNAEIDKTINGYKQTVQKKYLDSFGMNFNDVLARTPFNFIPTDQIGDRHQEDPLGNLITDGYIYSVKKAEGQNYEPVAVAVVTAGTVRGSFVKGDISVEDAFMVSSLGIGADGISGYPLISVYLSGKELRDLCEVDASISTLMSDAQLYLSGLDFTFNPNRLLFNRVTEAHLEKPDGTREQLEDNKLYRVVTGLYNAQMLSVVKEKSFGLLSIMPKTKSGKLITDFEAQIIHDNSNSRNNEVKEWLSTAQYLQSFKQVDGVSHVPEYYSTTHARKNVDNSKSLSAVFGNPNRTAIKLYFVIVAAITIIIFVVFLIVRHRSRRSLKRK